MIYLLIEFENCVFWIEADEESYALRQIIRDEQNNIHISCKEDCLAEGAINEHEIDGKISYISKNDFETEWSKAINPFFTKWQQTKKEYTIGRVVSGKALWNYPQGWIVMIEDARGLYKGIETINLNEKISGKIIGYDDINMWLLLK